MSGITTHVLDTGRGIPAEDVAVTLERRMGEAWHVIARARTGPDGRARLLAEGELPQPGILRLRFETGSWFSARGEGCFHPWIDVIFEVRDPDRHHHVPLLLGAYGYTTYRGS